MLAIGPCRYGYFAYKVFGAPSCSYIYIYICMYVYIYLYVCIYISVKMAAPCGSLTLLSYYSLCPHLRSH